MSVMLSDTALALLHQRAQAVGAPPPATPQQIEESERALGFRLSPALLQIYGRVANGGVGPGYGLMGLLEGAVDEYGDTAVSRYVADRDAPDILWPAGLVCLCSWGDGVYSCAEALDEAAPVSVFDPDALHYGEATEVLDARACLFLHRASVTEWLLAWARGADLWRTEMFPDPHSGVPGVSRLTPWPRATSGRSAGPGRAPR